MPPGRFVLKWYGDRVTRDVRELLKDNIVAAGYYLRDRVIENISEMSPPASDPGEYPHSVTRELIEATYVDENLTHLSLRVVNNSPHAMPLEQGTRYMAARPFMRRSMLEARAGLRERMLMPARGVSSGRFKFLDRS